MFSYMSKMTSKVSQLYAATQLLCSQGCASLHLHKFPQNVYLSVILIAVTDGVKEDENVK